MNVLCIFCLALSKLSHLFSFKLFHYFYFYLPLLSLCNSMNARLLSSRSEVESTAFCFQPRWSPVLRVWKTWQLLKRVCLSVVLHLVLTYLAFLTCFGLFYFILHLYELYLQFKKELNSSGMIYPSYVPKQLEHR